MTTTYDDQTLARWLQDGPEMPDSSESVTVDAVDLARVLDVAGLIEDLTDEDAEALARVEMALDGQAPGLTAERRARLDALTARTLEWIDSGQVGIRSWNPTEGAGA